MDAELTTITITTRHPDAYTLLDRRGHQWRIETLPGTAPRWVRDRRWLPPWVRVRKADAFARTSSSS